MNTEQLITRCRRLAELSEKGPEAPWTFYEYREHDGKVYHHLQASKQAIGTINTWPLQSAELIAESRNLAPVLAKIVPGLVEMLQSMFEQANWGIANERLGGNVVKEEFWKGQKSAAQQALATIREMEGEEG